MTVAAIWNLINDWAPFEWGAHWDNVGLQIGSMTQSVQRLCVSLEVDAGLLRHLESETYDLVITHHPVFFQPIRHLDLTQSEAKIAAVFLKKGMSLLSAHTNLDRAPEGVNDQLMRAFGYDPACAQPLDQGFGSILRLEDPIPVTELKNRFPKHRWVGDKDRVQTIAFCAGSGKSMMGSCIAQSADLLITGELGYHDEVEAGFQGLDLMILGHKESEVLVLPVIRHRILAQFPNLEVEIQ